MSRLFLRLAGVLLSLACGQTAKGPDDGSGAAGGAAPSGGSVGVSGSASGQAGSGGDSNDGGGDAAGGATPVAEGGAPNAGASSSGGAASSLVDCDPGKITCKRAAPVCGEMQVPSVEGICYGACVDVERCACSSAQACPLPEQYTCWGQEHCGPYVH